MSAIKIDDYQNQVNLMILKSFSINSHQQQQQQTSLSSSSSTTIDTTKVEQHSSLTTSMSMMEKSSTVSTSTTGVAFKELDIALKKIAKEQEEPVSVEMTLPSKKTRARSLSRNNTETLPDEVTFYIILFPILFCLIHVHV